MSEISHIINWEHSLPRWQRAGCNQLARFSQAPRGYAALRARSLSATRERLPRQFAPPPRLPVVRLPAYMGLTDS